MFEVDETVQNNKNVAQNTSEHFIVSDFSLNRWSPTIPKFFREKSFFPTITYSVTSKKNRTKTTKRYIVGAEAFDHCTYS